MALIKVQKQVYYVVLGTHYKTLNKLTWWPDMLIHFRKVSLLLKSEHVKPRSVFYYFKKNWIKKVKNAVRFTPPGKANLTCVVRHKRNNLFITYYEYYKPSKTIWTDTIGKHGLRGPKKRTIFAAEAVGKASRIKLDSFFKSKRFLKLKKRKKAFRRQIFRKRRLVFDLVVEGGMSSKVKMAVKQIKKTLYTLKYFWVKPLKAHNGMRLKKSIRTRRKRRRR
jgi:hypothetical protein